MSTPIGSLVRGIRLGRQLNLDQMARMLCVARRRLELVEAGVIFPTAHERRQWAGPLGFDDLLEFDRQWRDGWSRVTLAHRDGHVPIINKTPAGKPVDFEEYGIDSGMGYEYVERSPDRDPREVLFAVIIVGNSMMPAYQPGDLVIFRPLRTDELVDDGSPTFIRFSANRDHACTFKNVHRHPNGTIELRPENPSHETEFVLPEQIDRMALAVERRPGFCVLPREVRRLADEYAQELPEDEMRF